MVEPESASHEHSTTTSEPKKRASGVSTSSAKVVHTDMATNREDESIYRHIDTQISAIRSEMKGEIASVMAEIAKAEAQRSLDYNTLSQSLNAVRTSLPSKNDMWKITGAVVGGGIGLLGLFWAIFGAGASLTGSFADKVLERKEEQESIKTQLAEQNQLLKELKNDNAQAGNRTK